MLLGCKEGRNDNPIIEHYQHYHYLIGSRGTMVVKALCLKLEGRGSET
jgi:hypothetical protein